ncbi:MAG: methyl-accepting chemotaxis protein [Nitrospinota bacterium]|nr:methyl-accepting chemotaxis protein [Nitrospinota bacterium]
MIAIILVSGAGAYWGFSAISNAMIRITQDEAPLVDASMEMKADINDALINLEKYKSATTLISTATEADINKLITDFDHLVEIYDIYTDLILKGGDYEGLHFNATDNTQLSNKTLEADAMHNDKFQPLVKKLHENGKIRRKLKTDIENAMVAMEKTFEEVTDACAAMETAVKKVIADKRNGGQEAASLITTEVPWMDISMELVIIISESRIAIEEIVQTRDEKELAELEKEFSETIANFDHNIDALLSGGTTSMGRVPAVSVQSIRDLVTRIDKFHNDSFQPAAKKVVEAQHAIADVSTEIDKLLVDLDAVATAQKNILGEVEELAAGEMAEATEEGNSARNMANTIFAFMLIFSVAAGVVLGFLITASITRPINAIMEHLREGSDQVTTASSQISESSQSLASGATEQASALEETSSSLEEISGMVKQNADNSNQANAMMGESNRNVKEGVESMAHMVKAMDSIKDSSNEISKIIKVIEEIAFQTNLLALNAAVEAARAGEHGKGFAVVAEEVRNLAQRSATASKDTAALIENAVNKSIEGAKIVEQSAKSLEAIATGSKKVGDLVSEISAASGEQSQGVSQVTQAVHQLDEVTQKNAAVAEQSASASEELSAQAESLNGLVDELAELIYGKGNIGTAVKGSLPAPKH